MCIWGGGIEQYRNFLSSLEYRSSIISYSKGSERNNYSLNEIIDFSYPETPHQASCLQASCLQSSHQQHCGASAVCWLFWVQTLKGWPLLLLFFIPLLDTNQRPSKLFLALGFFNSWLTATFSFCLMALYSLHFKLCGPISSSSAFPFCICQELLLGWAIGFS